MLVSFGIGKYVAVNAIMGKFTLKWRATIDFGEDFLIAKKFNTKFALKYIITNSDIPVNVKFNRKYFSELLSLYKKGNLSCQSWTGKLLNSIIALIKNPPACL